MTTADRPFEAFAVVSGVEFSVEVSRRDEDHALVSLREYQADLKWWKCFYSEGADLPASDMDCIRQAFKRSRARMNNWARSWREHRQAAAQERGGKRGYYTKLANEAHAQMMKSAKDWKLCKAIWKEITKL